MKLNYIFYQNHVVDVAKNLIGKKLVFGENQGIITETEAYRGIDDAASHAHRGPTKRSSIMFGKPGYSYVYLIYGIYYCLNIVAEEEENPAAVLIRGLIILNSSQNSSSIPSNNFGIHLNGPGKICKYLEITKEHNAINMVESKNFYVTKGILNPPIIATPRIGINKAVDLPWRFVMDLQNLQ